MKFKMKTLLYLYSFLCLQVETSGLLFQKSGFHWKYFEQFNVYKDSFIGLKVDLKSDTKDL